MFLKKRCFTLACSKECLSQTYNPKILLPKLRPLKITSLDINAPNAKTIAKKQKRTMKGFIADSFRKKVVKKENININGNRVIFQSITKASNLLNLTLILNTSFVFEYSINERIKQDISYFQWFSSHPFSHKTKKPALLDWFLVLIMFRTIQMPNAMYGNYLLFLYLITRIMITIKRIKSIIKNNPVNIWSHSGMFR